MAHIWAFHDPAPRTSPLSAEGGSGCCCSRPGEPWQGRGLPGGPWPLRQERTHTPRAACRPRSSCEPTSQSAPGPGLSRPHSPSRLPGHCLARLTGLQTTASKPELIPALTLRNTNQTQSQGAIYTTGFPPHERQFHCPNARAPNCDCTCCFSLPHAAHPITSSASPVQLHFQNIPLADKFLPVQVQPATCPARTGTPDPDRLWLLPSPLQSTLRTAAGGPSRKPREPRSLPCGAPTPRPQGSPGPSQAAGPVLCSLLLRQAGPGPL